MTFAPPRRGSPMLARDVRREIGAHLLPAEEAARREKILMRLEEAIEGARRVDGHAVKLSVDSSGSHFPSQKVEIASRPADDLFRIALRSLLRLLCSRSSMDALGEKRISQVVSVCQLARGLDHDIDRYLNNLACHVLKEREKPRGRSASPPPPAVLQPSQPAVKSKKELPISPKLRLGREHYAKPWGLPSPTVDRPTPQRPLEVPQKVPTGVVLERVANVDRSPLLVGRGRTVEGIRSLIGRSQPQAANTASLPPSRSPESHGDGGEGQFPAWAAHPVQYREMRVEEVRKAWAKQERETAHAQELQRRHLRAEGNPRTVFGKDVAVRSEGDSAAAESSRKVVASGKEPANSCHSDRSRSPAGLKKGVTPPRSVSPARVLSPSASQRSLPHSTNANGLIVTQVPRSPKLTTRKGPFDKPVSRQVAVARRTLSSVYGHCASRLFVDSLSKSFKRSGKGKSLDGRGRLERTRDEYPTGDFRSTEATLEPFARNASGLEACGNILSMTASDEALAHSTKADQPSSVFNNSGLPSGPKAGQQAGASEGLSGVGDRGNLAPSVASGYNEGVPPSLSRSVNQASNGFNYDVIGDDSPAGRRVVNDMSNEELSVESGNVFRSFGASVTAFASSLMASVSSSGDTSHDLGSTRRAVATNATDDSEAATLAEPGSSVRERFGSVHESAVSAPAEESEASATPATESSVALKSVIAESMRRRSERIISDAISRVEGGARNGLTHGSSQGSLLLASIPEASNEDAVDVDEPRIGEPLEANNSRASASLGDLVTESDANQLLPGRDGRDLVAHDSFVDEETREGTHTISQSVRGVALPHTRSPQNSAGSTKTGRFTGPQPRAPTDATLTMSASKLYETYIASRNDEEDERIVNREAAKAYVDFLSQRILRTSASGARQRRILSGSGFYRKPRW
ncbi:hypothetical protein FOZ63_007762 [Perkinsus olseni]|uniref:Uncharacterized protein n=2 Tax=Perkinsus olseni TaxID=32597 RepID=A0A7J6UP18_PEROL|nr:hypothetical protein FOZ63_007762 [Perkinsus olseni]